MIVLIIFIILILIILFVFRKYNDPHKLYMVFGKKGSGKSSYLTKLAYTYKKKGWDVLTTEDLDIEGVRKVDIRALGHCVTAPHTVLLIDEVGMIWDNRDYKNFRTDVRDYFKLQRHYKTIVYLFSQSFDVDKKLRDLTDGMFLVTKLGAPLSLVRRIKRTVTLVQPTAESEGRIADSLEFVPVWYALFGVKTWSFTWLPRWAKYFHSYDVPDKPYL